MVSGGMLGQDAYDPLDPATVISGGTQPVGVPNLPATPNFWSDGNSLLDKPSLSERMLAAGTAMLAASESGASLGGAISAGMKGYSDAIKEHKEQRKKDRMDRLAEYDLLGRIRERQMTEIQTAKKMQTLDQLKKDNPNLATLIDLDPDAAAQVIADRFKPKDRKIIEQGGVSYYADTGEPVLPGVAPPISGPFEGTSMDAQVSNILLRGDPSSPDYLAAYNIAAQPKMVIGPDGVPQQITPDMSAYRVPIIGASGNAPVTVQQLSPIADNIQIEPGISVPTIAADLSDPVASVARKAPPVAPITDPIAIPSLPAAPPAQPQMGPKGGVTPMGKKTNFSGEALANAGFASRMVEMNALIEDLPGTAQEAKTGRAGNIESALSVVPFMDPVGAAIVHRNATPAQQQYLNAAQNWIRANLRKESGAVIGEQEMKDEYATYFPVPGDSKAVIKQKENLRKITTNAMIKSSAGAYEEPKQDLTDEETKRMIELLRKKAGK